jgi:hypothetical protein
MKSRIFEFIVTEIILELIIAAIILIVCGTFALAQQTGGTNKRIEVKIYLQKTEIDPSGATSLEIAPVKRRVNAAEPLRGALESLFAPIFAEDTARAFSSSTAGTRFEGVELKNGTALVKFSEPPGDVSADLGIFRHAVEQTAKQFRAVKRVEICAIGDTLIDSESANTFPRCSPEKYYWKSQFAIRRAKLRINRGGNFGNARLLSRFKCCADRENG